MASSSRGNVVGKSSIFIAWREQAGNHEFYLQLQNSNWILAVVGVMTDNTNVKYFIDTTFYKMFKPCVTGLGKGEWRHRSDVVEWLKAQIQLENVQTSQAITNAGFFSVRIDTEDHKTRLAFPSGYTDAYNFPSRTQMVIKHGAQSFDVIVENGWFTQGWNDFVTMHDIKCRWVVNFHWIGNSTYETQIFDSTNRKKTYKWSTFHEWL